MSYSLMHALGLDEYVPSAIGFINEVGYGYDYYSVINFPPKPNWAKDYTGFVPSIAPSLYRSPRTTPVASQRYTRGNGLNGDNQEVLHNHEVEMCGMCRHAMNSHHEECERYSESLFGDYVHDYYQYGVSNHIVPYVDYAGHHNEEPLTTEDEWDSVHSLGDFSTEEFYWKDSEPTECTSLLGNVKFDKANSVKGTAVPDTATPRVKMNDKSVLSMRISTAAYEPQSRNAFVEGQHGFASAKLIDFFVSEKADNKILNVYRKDGILRIGSLMLFPTHTADNVTGEIWTRIRAVCGNKRCLVPNGNGSYKQHETLIEGYEISREQMEDFVIAIIRHGNNHCADWFQTREYARSTRVTLESSKPIKIGTTWIEEPELLDNGIEVIYKEVGVYAKDKQKESQVLSPWTIQIPRHHTFYKVHAVDCELNCDASKPHCVAPPLNTVA